ncbi:FAD/NAD(P)-binding domain-containing protein [Echria macrotheca]|uniref:FAD/NAD(P)-binding domain-containing protein n=1 Tax=Echria macrotheca TaxID=438768 RepID=A0AAJ0FGN2_9PEZI|nr:FAD/NAD(P)-binding domain-containing protein [Echria macrotheca]
MSTGLQDSPRPTASGCVAIDMIGRQSQPRRRRRPALSCLECRRRKIKCDRADPCRHCVSAKVQCTFRTYSLPPPSAPSDLSGQAQHEGTLSTDEVTAEPVATSHANYQSSVATLESGLQDLHIILNTTRIMRFQTSIAPEFKPIINCFARASSQSLETEAVVGQIGELLRECKGTAKKIKAGRHASTRPSNAVLGITLPRRDVAAEMATLYFRFFESTYRILHTSSFWSGFNKFWDDPENATADHRLKVLLVVAIGSSLYEHGDGRGAWRRMVDQWVYAAEAWLAVPLKNRLSIAGLQVHCLTILARQMLAVGGDLVWVSVGSLIHKAMELGLHRDPKHLPSMSVLQAELRRRLWATIAEMAIQASLDSAMPPRISLDEFDTEAPANVNDDEIDDTTQSPLLPRPRHAGGYTSTSIQLLLLDSLPVRLRTLQLLSGLHSSLEYADVLALSAEISDACRAATAYMRENKGLGILPFHRNMVDYLVRRFLLPLHRPFATEAQTNPLLYGSVKVSLDTAMSVIAPEPDEYFSRAMAIGGGLFREGFRSAMTAISLELLVQVQAQHLDGTLHRNSQYRGVLKQAVRDMIALSIRRIEQGETNVKAHMFLHMILAQAEAVEAGVPCEQAIAQAAKDSLAFCLALLQAEADSARDSDLMVAGFGDGGDFDLSHNSTYCKVSSFAILAPASATDLSSDSVSLIRSYAMTRMKVLISGAGIAGNSLALLLSRLGHDVTVIERFPDLRSTGLQVDLRGHGVEVIKRMGLDDELQAKLVPEQGLEVVNSAGTRQGFFPANKTSSTGHRPPMVQNFTSDYEIMRGDLCRLLYDAAVKSRARFEFSTSIESFDDGGGDAVQVKFADGRTSRFDVVVGADGQGSSTRRKLFGSAVADAAYHPFKNTYMAYFTIPRPIQPGEDYVATMYIAPGRRGIMTRRHSPHELQVYLGCSSTKSPRLDMARRRGDVGEQKAAWAEIFKGAGWKSDEILEALMAATTEADNFYVESAALVKLASWSRGRVALVGDAAWCPTATTGVGTTCAIVGAYVLASEIAKHCGGVGGHLDVPTNPEYDALHRAFQAYERKFQPYMAQVQKDVSVEDDGYWAGLASSKWGIYAFHWLVAIASFLKLNLGRWMLKEEIGGWQLPDYKGMDHLDTGSPDRDLGQQQQGRVA